MSLKIYFILVSLFLFFNSYVTVSKFPILIVISFDGFRHDYLNKTETPFLNSLANNGVRAEWMENVFVTKTFPNHFSIATGLYEEIHGIISNYMYDPETDKIFDIPTMLDEHWWNNNFSTPIWIANQLFDKDRHSGGVFWSGMDVPYFNTVPKHYLPFNSSIPWEERVDIATSWLTFEKEPANLILMYFEEPDASGHIYGPDSEEVKKQIRRADNIIGYLIKKLKDDDLFTKTNIIILSDHGMANVTGVIDLDEHVSPDLYDTYGASPVFNLWPHEGKEETVYESLKNASLMDNNFFVYKRKDVPEEYHYSHHRRILPIVVEAKEGWGLKNKNHTDTPLGDHGYNNSLLSMKPIFLAHGPAFKTKYVSEPFMNLDVYPLMCNILGIKAPVNNGSLENIDHILHKKPVTGIQYPAYLIIVVCIVLALFLVIAAYHTACSYKPVDSKYSTVTG